MWRGDKTPLVQGGGRRAGLSARSLRPPEQLLLLAPVFFWGGGRVDLGFFLFEKRWKIVWWQMPWMGSTFLPPNTLGSPLI